MALAGITHPKSALTGTDGPTHMFTVQHSRGASRRVGDSPIATVTVGGAQQLITVHTAGAAGRQRMALANGATFGVRVQEEHGPIRTPATLVMVALSPA